MKPSINQPTYEIPQVTPLEYQQLGDKFLEISKLTKSKTLLLLAEKNESYTTPEENQALSLTKTSDHTEPDPQKSKTITPFADFMTKLQRFQKPVENLPDEITSWSGLPLENIVSDGLWLIMLKLSQKYNLKLSTENEVFNKMSPIVNHMVNLGLYLTYGSNSQAALEDFQKEVIAKIEQEIYNQPNFHSCAPQEIWQVFCAQFFAKLINNAREKTKLAHLSLQELPKIIEFNKVKTQPQFHYLDKLSNIPIMEADNLTINSIKSLLETPNYNHRLCEELKSNPTGKISDDCKVLLKNNQQTILEMKKEIEQLIKLPIKFSQIPDDLINLDELNIKIHWIKTQLLTTLIGSNRDFLNEYEIMQASLLLEKVDQEQLIKKTIARWQSKGMKLDQNAETYFVNLLQQSINSLKLLLVGKNFDHASASAALLYRLEGKKSSSNGKTLPDQSVLSPKIKAKEFAIQLETGTALPQMYKIFQSMEGEEKNKALRILLREDLPVSIIKSLIEQNLLTIVHPQVYKIHHQLDKNWLAANFFQLGEHEESTERKEQMNYWLKIFINLDKQNFQTISGTEEGQKRILNIIVESMSYDPDDIKKLYKRLNKEYLEKIIFKWIIEHREFTYSTVGSDQENPWSSKQNIEWISSLLCYSIRKTTALLKSKTEETLLRELFTEDENINQRIAAFISNREKYFAQQNHSTPSTESSNPSTTAKAKKASGKTT